MNKEENVIMLRKAEIDTRAPFRSVKEAVSLFGDKVLAGELYANANKLKQMQSGDVAAELEETRENLQRAKEESMLMAHCMSSLQEELQRTKEELQQLKQRETINHHHHHHSVESEIEDVKFVENLTTFESKSCRFNDEEFHKKRYVTFANQPSMSHVMIPPHHALGFEKLERHASLRNKNKKKSFIPLIGSIFSRKKGSHQVP
ncbi:PREDICTED: WEB family protein At1g75720-like isoform X2 [Lupinus angustifolius]|uniref:WEB family protein At1g75720-like isoform X2 n=1 Tax=Lupinus angustifolius TaxID=3871 RepID=UPI00092E9C39|nr:PREDICTED: WEB family protein At1g75720-like isoform X2 [Lupinus angustifolius]